MKSNLKILGLALCMLPMYLHAGTGQDLKQAYQSAQAQNTQSAAPIPAGTILPITLNSALRSDKSGNGATITATVMQDVPLGTGKTLRKGSNVTGHVVESVASGKRSDESRISFQFDQIRLGNQTIAITTNLRAIASRSAVLAATPELTSPDYSDYQVQIGGDQVSYGSNGPVMLESRVVGKYTSQGVLAYASADLGSSCGGTSENSGLPQAFWLFSVNACGSYGFGDLKILQPGVAQLLGEVTLVSNRKAVKIDKGSAMLLRVSGSGSEEAQARTTPPGGTGQ